MILSRSDIRERIDRINGMLRASGLPELPAEARAHEFIDAMIRTTGCGIPVIVSEVAALDDAIGEALRPLVVEITPEEAERMMGSHAFNEMTEQASDTMRERAALRAAGVDPDKEHAQ